MHKQSNISSILQVDFSCKSVIFFELWLKLQESKIDMSKLQLTADQLAEMVSLIEDGTISGKIAKQILPDLLQVGLHGDSSS